ncbi:lactoylglutathione lyase [Pedobacter ginsengisoli]|uniref:Lactoylglutathione lyase n=1 Tax=Pedobacter ginsengisoli TaxID=363852 RepID=A0A2D1U379_9SPHI|nr:VOC family protein [Pedobacter ginsengisoli]ATP56059.1 lactoylglutathione lyase [Pedobacter ginsengisoli]
MTAKNPFVWTEISVNDLARAKKFYETVLQVELVELPPPDIMKVDKDDPCFFEMLAFPADMMGTGSSGTLVKSNMSKPGPGGTFVYFHADDCAVELSRVEAAGGKVVFEKMSLGEYGFCCAAEDTEGNHIGFHSMK